MPKFETLDSTALNEAIRSSFTEKEFRNHSFDKDCSDMIDPKDIDGEAKHEKPYPASRVHSAGHA